MLKKYCRVLILFLFTVQHAVAFQRSVHPDLSKLEIVWSVIQNHYDGKDQALSSFTILNHTPGRLPASGWKLYFNYNRTILPQMPDSKLQIAHVNGDLYYLYPVAGFGGLEQEQQISFTCISTSWIVNNGDSPQGFYIVWDDDADQGIALKNLKVNPPADAGRLKRFQNDDEPLPEALYQLNERAAKLKSGQVCKIFPQPSSYHESPGFFTIRLTTAIGFDAAFKAEAALLSDDIGKLLGKKPALLLGAIHTAPIRLLKNAAIASGYRLNVTPSAVLISAADAKGIFQGIQSFKTLIDPVYDAAPQNSIPVKCVEVTDAPAFGVRAIMLDVARNFQSEAELIKLIDLLALYKFNTLHLHLDDDEGWRLQIPSLPELTTVGAKRGHSAKQEQYLQPAYGSGPAVDASAGSGYYTRDQFVHILKYAAQRHISIIPEIETPGHARAAVKAMAARYKHFMATGDSVKARQYLLQTFNDASVYHSVQQWDDNVMDVSLPSVYTFLTTVTDDIIAMYLQAGLVLPTIHFGGDEVPAGVWEGSPAVKALRLKDTSIKAPADLWNYFFSRINAMLNQRGMYLSGWEETGLYKTMVDGKKRWLPNPLFANKNFHVNVWNNLRGNEDLAYRLANSGYKVILSFVTNFYFDMAYNKSFNEHGVNWGGLIDVEQSFKFIPFDYLRNKKTDYLGKPLAREVVENAEKLSPAGESNILGIQGLLWTETVKTPERLEYMYLPRLLALAQRAWAKQPEWMRQTDTLKAAEAYNLDWAGFAHQAGRELVRLDRYSGGYNYRIPLAAVKKTNGLVYANTDIPGLQIRYTTDGTLPNAQSKLYTLPIADKGLITFRVFSSTGRGGHVIKVNEGTTGSAK